MLVASLLKQVWKMDTVDDLWGADADAQHLLACGVGRRKGSKCVRPRPFVVLLRVILPRSLYCRFMSPTNRVGVDQRQ